MKRRTLLSIYVFNSCFFFLLCCCCKLNQKKKRRTNFGNPMKLCLLTQHQRLHHNNPVNLLCMRCHFFSFLFFFFCVCCIADQIAQKQLRPNRKMDREYVSKRSQSMSVDYFTIERSVRIGVEDEQVTQCMNCIPAHTNSTDLPTSQIKRCK